MNSESSANSNEQGKNACNIPCDTPKPRSEALISGAQALLEALIVEGVDTVFGYPGGTIMPFYDALLDFQDEMRHILVRHEQGASHAAEGYARITGKVGVCVATSGPGATNLVTGIADAMMDSVPLVCITGQVISSFLGTDAFQETDVIGITIPITKWNYQITKACEIPAVLAKAFHIARSGRPGPVVIDITKDAQTELFGRADAVIERPRSNYGHGMLMQSEVERAAQIINRARRPYLLLGHGVLIADAVDEVRQFAERAEIPVACTLHGLSAFPTGHPLYVGMLGMHGNYGANVLTNSADVIIGVGIRFDDRVTANLAGYAKNAKLIHIEVEPAQVGKVIPAEVALIADAKEALGALAPLIKENQHSLWLEEFRKCDEQEHEEVLAHAVKPLSGSLKMSEVISVLSEHSNGEALIVADVGQQQMMAARYYKFKNPKSFISSGGLGTMGFALPAAFGAKVGSPEREVIAVIGDGGFQMTIQELATIVQENVAVKIIVLNNSYLGMVRQWQELFFEKRYSSVAMKNPDFVGICKAFGLEATRVEDRKALPGEIDKLLKFDGPYFLEVVVENEQNVFPMIPAGKSVNEMRLS